MLYAYFQLRDMFTAVWPCAMIDERWLCWQCRHGEVLVVTLPGKALNLEPYIRMVGTELGGGPNGREGLRMRSRKWPQNGSQGVPKQVPSNPEIRGSWAVLFGPSVNPQQLNWFAP